MARFGAVASQTLAGDVVRDALTEGKSALSAALSGYFAAAGAHPGVIFAPFALLVGGLGAGVFAYDGRLRQPGRDAKRPRGFVEGEEIPRAAYVAAPTSAAAAFLACAFQPGTSFLSCVRPGIASAKEVSSKGRAALLDIIASKGAGWLSDSPLKKALIAQCGTVEGGLLTPTDLTAPDNLQVKAARRGDSFRTPWSAEDDDLASADPDDVSLGRFSEGRSAERRSAGERQAIVVCDGRGLFALLSYGVMDGSTSLDGYEVILPTTASPVRRNVPRVAPGTPLPFFDGLSLMVGDDGTFVAAEAVLSPGQVLRLDRDVESKSVSIRRVG